MSFQSQVVRNAQTVEYGKFVEIQNDSRFPAISVTRVQYKDSSSAFPNNLNIPPLTSVEIYPKYGVITYLANASDIQVSLSAGILNVGDVKVTNTAAVSGSVTVLNPTSAINVTYPLDSGNIDAFGRLRVSFPTTLFDSKTLHNKASLFWSQTAVGVGAVVQFTGEGTDASVTLSAAANGAYAIRQTTQRFNYQPGKSQLCLYTGVLTPVSNALKRIGSFQSLTAAPYYPNCGLYFETQTDSPSSIAVVQQNNSFLVPTVSARRENWNIDKLDGRGPSGKILQLSAANIFMIDYEWLGVGRTRYGFVIDGQICYCHAFNNAGNVPGAYMLTPNLPVRAELRQTGAGSATMKMICCSIMSEAGADFTGVTRAVTNGSTKVAITTNGNRRALIGVRLQATKLDSVNEVLNASIFAEPGNNATTAPFLYELVTNPTLGGSAVTWTDVDANSNFQYAVAPDNTVTVSGGTVIAAGYSNLNNILDLANSRFEKFLRLGCTVTGERDQLWLVVTPLASNTINGFYGGITFIESD